MEWQPEEERRRHLRFLCTGDAEIRSLVSGVATRGRIVNLSPGGCLIEPQTAARLRRHEPVEMTFMVRQLPVRVQGAVRQVHGDGTIGVQFTLLTERGKRHLGELIAELGELLQGEVVQIRSQTRRER